MVNSLLALQIIGTSFGLVMLYVSFVHFRRNTYTYRSLTLWCFVWVFFTLTVLFPQLLRGVLHTFRITRVLDFYIIGGMLFFSGVVFYLYVAVKKTERRVERLLSKYALENPETKKK